MGHDDVQVAWKVPPDCGTVHKRGVNGNMNMQMLWNTKVKWPLRILLQPAGVTGVVVVLVVRAMVTTVWTRPNRQGCEECQKRETSIL